MTSEQAVPKVVILVLNWNSERDTTECIRSLEKIDYSNYQIIIIDNGSPDGSGAILQKTFPEHAFIQTGKNLGYAGGNNAGIQYALDRGADFILILNNDAVASPDLLDVLVKSAIVYPQGCVLSPLICDYKNPEKILYAGSRWNSEKACFINHEREGAAGAYATEYAAGSALFFSANVARKIGVFDPRFFLVWEETDWCFRARCAGFPVLIEPRTRVRHKGSSSFEGGSGGALYSYYYFRNRWFWIEKNLTGKEKLISIKKCFRDFLTHFKEWVCARAQDSSKKRSRMIILGNFHFFLRRFGAAPHV